MDIFDEAVETLRREHNIPGASLAVAYGGRLVLVRGYGLADTTSGTPVQPSHRFRIASVTKPITATGVLYLVEEGRLALDDRVFAILDDLKPPSGYEKHPGVNEITVRQLLYHTGGFDRTDFDPMHNSDRIAEVLGVPPPATVDQIIQAMLSRPLDFDPGTRQVYSNYGYALLGRVIEEVTGSPYEAYVQEAVLQPAGATGMQLGRSWPADRPPDEVSYYRLQPPTRVRPIGPDSITGGRLVPFPDGGIHVEAWKAHGGWIGTPTDLVRFALAVDGDTVHPDVLSPSTWAAMMAPPPDAPENAAMHALGDAYYAMGWYVRPSPNRRPDAWWHMGDQPGTTALLLRDGPVQIAFLANRSPWSRKAHDEVHTALRAAAQTVKDWPTHDLFANERTDPVRP